MRLRRHCEGCPASSQRKIAQTHCTKCPTLLGLLALCGRIILKIASIPFTRVSSGIVGCPCLRPTPMQLWNQRTSNRLRTQHEPHWAHQRASRQVFLHPMVLLLILTLTCDCTATVHTFLDLASLLTSVVRIRCFLSPRTTSFELHLVPPPPRISLRSVSYTLASDALPPRHSCSLLAHTSRAAAVCL